MKAASARSHGSRYGIMRSPKILKLRGLKYWDMGYATLFTRESWAAFVSRTVLCNSWGARGTADLKIHTPTSPSPPISLSPPFWNGNAFTLRRHSGSATRGMFSMLLRISCQLSNAMTVKAWERGEHRWLALIRAMRTTFSKWRLTVPVSFEVWWSWFEAHSCSHVCLQWYKDYHPIFCRLFLFQSHVRNNCKQAQP